jgi:hypothetical protein
MSLLRTPTSMNSQEMLVTGRTLNVVPVRFGSDESWYVAPRVSL